jgi:hypothetical protein
VGDLSKRGTETTRHPVVPSVGVRTPYLMGIAVHMFYRHKTDAWTKPWGGFKDVQGSKPA